MQQDSDVFLFSNTEFKQDKNSGWCSAAAGVSSAEPALNMYDFN